jgi:hypothetical protein
MSSSIMRGMAADYTGNVSRTRVGDIIYRKIKNQGLLRQGCLLKTGDLKNVTDATGEATTSAVLVR